MRVRALLAVAVLFGLLAVYGCAHKTTAPTGAETSGQPSSAPPAPVGTTGLTGAALGEQIFTKGVGTSGQHLAFTEGSDRFKQDPGGCEGCHGADGLGKKLKTITTPPITYSALLEPQDGKPAMYTLDTIHNPIEKGVDEEGKPLKNIMPRWQMSNDELQGLVDYLKTLDTKPPAATPEAAPKAEAGKPAPETK